MNQMAFTSSSSLKHSIISPKISIKPGLIPKPHSSSSNFINFAPPLNSGKICAAITNVAPILNREDVKSEKPEEDLPAGLEEKLMPKHIAFILDGNRRWAVEKGRSPSAGHTAMRMTLKPLLRRCSKLKIKGVSLFAFSTENWNRPIEEVDFLMELYEDMLRVDTEELLSLDCRISIIGDKTKLPKTLREVAIEIEEKSKGNLGTHVNFAINYSGKYDITQACRSIASKVKDGVILPNQINENIFEQELDTKTNDFPCLDLIIRTSGEIRISNFMLWQLAYSELYYVKKLFPDFKENDLIKALLAFQETRKST